MRQVDYGGIGRRLFCFFFTVLLFFIFFLLPASASSSLNILVDDYHNVISAGAYYTPPTPTLQSNSQYVIISHEAEGIGFHTLQFYCTLDGGYGWFAMDGYDGAIPDQCIGDYEGLQLITSFLHDSSEVFYVYSTANYATTSFPLRVHATNGGYIALSVYEIIGDEDIFDFEANGGYVAAIFADPFASSTYPRLTYEFTIYNQNSGTLSDWGDLSDDYYEKLQTENNYRDATGAFIIPKMQNEFSISPTAAPDRISLLQITMNSDPSPTGTTTFATAEYYGLMIAPYWTCCYGQCEFPISMPPQLGWWGIGDTVARTLTYTIATSSEFEANFSTTTVATIQVPEDLIGFHTMNYELYIDYQLAATGTTLIEIIAAEECVSTDELDYLEYCEEPCAGVATSTNPLDFDNFLCAMYRFGCWLTKPDQAQIGRLVKEFQTFTTRFPLAPITDMYYNLVAVQGSDEGAVQAGQLILPQANTIDGRIEQTTIDLTNSDILDTHAYDKFRRLQRIALWVGGAALPITIIILGLLL